MPHKIYFESPPVKKQDLKLFYETSNKYLAELNKHDDKYLKTYVDFVSRYTKENFKILDLGCGNGRSTYLLSKSRNAFLAIGCDLTFKFLDTSSYFKKNNLAYMVADAAKLPLKDEGMDIVTSFQFVEHAIEIRDVLREMMRVLKKGGIILIMSPNLLSPFTPLRKMNLPLSLRNTVVSLKKLMSGGVKFLFRKPSLDKGFSGPDSDSIYLANQIDIKKFFKKHGFEIINITEGMSYAGKITARLFPDFNGEIGIAARKAR